MYMLQLTISLEEAQIRLNEAQKQLVGASVEQAEILNKSISYLRNCTEHLQFENGK